MPRTAASGSLLHTAAALAFVVAVMLSGCTTSDGPAASPTAIESSPSTTDTPTPSPSSASPSVSSSAVPSPSASLPSPSAGATRPPTPSIRPGATPTPSRPASPTPSISAPAPASSPPASPSAPPSPPAAEDPSAWIIDFDGIGPLTIGGRLADPVSPALTETTDAVVDPDVCRFFTADGVDPLTIAASSPGRIGGVIAVDKESPVGLPRTAEGIGNGSTEVDLLAAYPEAVLVYAGPSRSYSVTNGAGRFIHFAFGEGPVVQGVFVLEGPDLPSEYCL